MMERTITITLPAELIERLGAIDCGDNSCMFRDPKAEHWIGTNGGCRCFNSLPFDQRFPVKRVMDRVLRELRQDDTIAIGDNPARGE